MKYFNTDLEALLNSSHLSTRVVTEYYWKTDTFQAITEKILMFKMDPEWSYQELMLQLVNTPLRHVWLVPQGEAYLTYSCMFPKSKKMTSYTENITNYTILLLKMLNIDMQLILASVCQWSSMLGGSLVTTAWRVLRLRMEGTPSRYGG
jgi:hypothetical protein